MAMHHNSQWMRMARIIIQVLKCDCRRAGQPTLPFVSPTLPGAVQKTQKNEPREKQAVVGSVMRAILISLVVAVTASSALAESDQALGERISHVVRDEWERQDCLWR